MSKATYYDRRRNRHVSYRTGHAVCACGRGYASEYDGLCTRCRGGVSAYEQKQKDAKKGK